jgi:HK97 family phage prohead protease
MEQKYKIGEKGYMQLPIEVKSIDKEAGKLEAIFSTQDVDRHGDTVMQDGWDLKNFKKNPVILNSHNYGDATEVIGRADNVRVEGKKLIGDITFAVNENPKAKIIFDLYSNKFLSAFSVGFIPTKFKENKDGSRDWFVIEESELLEVSAVSVPANARALAKAKGIDIDALQIKENDNDETKPEEPANEVPKDNEVPPVDGDTVADKGDDSESGSKEGDETGEQGGNDNGDKETVPEENSEVVEEKAVKKVSYISKVANAIRVIESKEKAQLRKVADIVGKLLHDEFTGANIDKKTKEQIRKRKVNQAIRELIKAR